MQVDIVDSCLENKVSEKQVKDRVPALGAEGLALGAVF
jgi:hypothetical protein